MRRAIKVFGALVAALFLFGVLSVALARGAGEHTLIARLLSRFTSGELVVHRLTGNLLSSPRFGEVEVRDARGTWAIVHDLSIDWSPSRLLHREVDLSLFQAARIEVLRRPVFAQAGGKSSWHGFRLDIARLHVGRLDLAPSVIGAPATLAADGSLHMAAPDEGRAVIALARLDAAGAYTAKADFSPVRIDAVLWANEKRHGLLARIARVPDIGPLKLNATLAGPRTAEATKLWIKAGGLTAAARGKLDLDHSTLDLDVTASAPAMAPRPDLSWKSVALDAHAHGPFAAPNATGTLSIIGLAASGASVGRIAADVSGNSGQVALRARAEDIRVPGPKPDLFGAAPVRLSAEARLNAPGRPVSFSLAHPLLTAKGEAQTVGPIAGNLAVQIPALAPLAAAAGLDLQGHAGLAGSFSIADAAKRLALNGTLAITGGEPRAVALIGADGRIALDASLTGDTLTLSGLRLGGRAIGLAASGSIGLAAGSADLAWTATLADLRAAVPILSGRLAAEGRLNGTRANFALTAKASGEVGGKGFAPGPVSFAVALDGLPSAPRGHVSGQGVLAQAPLALAVDLSRSPDGATRLAIQRADWKSAHAEGTLTLAPSAKLPQGRIAVRIARLQDLRPFIGADIGGSVAATADLGASSARVRAAIKNLRLPGTAEVAAADLDARLSGPGLLAGHPVVDAKLTATGVRTPAASGSLSLTVRGPEQLLAVQLGAKLQQFAGAPATIEAAGTVDATARTATLASLQATWKGARAHLLAPARVDFGATKSVRQLRLGIDGAVLEANGRIAPTLDLRLTATNVTADLVRDFVPSLNASGRLKAEAQLTGTLAAPRGTVRINGTGLRWASAAGRALPAADLAATASLNGATVRVDARVTAGAATRISLTGAVGLAPAGKLDLHTGGSVDLAMLNPLTEAQGIMVRGRLALEAMIGGTLHAPRLGGTARLAGGDVQDYTHGAHLANITASFAGAGDTLRITRLAARAGRGTLAASGSIGVLAPGMPLALRVTMSDASPLASNLLTATLDADVSLGGKVEGQLRAAGNIRIRQAEIHVPEHMPQSVAVLPVRIGGQPGSARNSHRGPALLAAPPAPSPAPEIALDLNLSAPGRIYVRGRGLNVELSGRLHLGGTMRHPAPSGAFRMIRGRYEIAGTTLTFTEGRIGFTGRSTVTGGDKIDPALHFVATSSGPGVTATLTVGGFASDPRITLSSVPQLPQDEVLAQLLFGRSIKNLSPFQIAEIAATLAQISGVGSVGIGDPLNRLRNTLGLDRLTIGTDPVNPAITPGTQQNQNNTVVQAGRYVAPGVYLGAKQGIIGGTEQTQATLQIDLTKHLKLQTGAGAGQGANNVGLTYQFQY